MYTKYHSKYFASELSLKRATDTIENLTVALSNAKVDLNPHQVDAALFALKSPLSSGVLLADEVGLGKTIEAGLVISQKWAERKRKILLIMPSSLRKQWNQELMDKFFIDSIIMENKLFNQKKKEGSINPFDIENKLVICSYNFASKKSSFIKKVNWDLVIIDEAHRLRNVYKDTSKMSNNIRDAIKGYKKVLLTATPLQNNLMELFGLVSIIDEHVFGDKKSFREQFIKGLNEETRNNLLRKRISLLCKRTLRKQVVEYVPYTERKAIVREYYPTDDEIRLYEEVSNYLRKDKLYALPPSQRHLMTLILRKLLASSSYAIASTLESLVTRLGNMLNEKAIYIEDTIIDDVDFYEEFKDEVGEEDGVEIDFKINSESERMEIQEEKQLIQEFVELAKKIEENTKGKELLEALKVGFKVGSNNGAAEKVVIFTESRRTQDYLYQLLNNNGYENEIVLINGTNTDKRSKEIYKKWTGNSDNENKITGSKTADMKAALVDEFRNNSKILIATEAAAEGINFQFCSLVVNYDLPWNPQRVEQRIGRCHRYGQKNDVVVINFINMRNEADKRVYALLSEKFRLFDGIFGASDEVLGTIESGVDFEKRISEIYQNCRTTEEIENAFNEIQQELDVEIQETIRKTRSSLLENFDEEVHEKLKGCKNETEFNLSKYQNWILNLVIAELNEDIILDGDKSRFYYKGEEFKKGYYDFNWKRAEETRANYLRSNGTLINKLVTNSITNNIGVGYVDINYSNYKMNYGKITVFDKLESKSGWLIVDKLTVEAFETEEILIFTGVTDLGEILDEELAQKLLYIDSNESMNEKFGVIPKKIIETKKNDLIGKHKNRIEKKNMKFFDDETDKLELWAEDLKHNLEQEIKDIDDEIKTLKREGRMCSSLEDKLSLQRKVKELERKRNKKRRDLFEEQDIIDEKRDELIYNMERQLKRKEKIENVIVVKWNLI